MIIDNTIAEVILNTEKETGVNKNTVIDIMTAYYKAVNIIIEEKSPASIKMDLFGKLSYNNALKERREALNLE